MVLRPAFAASRRWHALLSHRGILAVEGADSRKLLQGLTTANVLQIDAGPLYTAFLDVKGRVLTDAFLVPVEEGVLIDVDANSLPSLAKHIKRYKLRSKVNITDRSAELSVMASVDADSVDAEHGHEGTSQAMGVAAAELGGAWEDPRLSMLGQRAIVQREASTALSEQLMEASSESAVPDLYSLMLAILGVPEGPVQLRPGEALPLESNLELLSGLRALPSAHPRRKTLRLRPLTIGVYPLAIAP